MIVDRVQQGPVQIEKDGRVAWIFSDEIFVAGHFSRYHTIGFRPALDARSSRCAAENLREVDFLCPLELCFVVGFRS